MYGIYDSFVGKANREIMMRRNERMPFGMIVLTVVSVLLLFGVGQRVLDRLRLDDKTAICRACGKGQRKFVPTLYFP